MDFILTLGTHVVVLEWSNISRMETFWNNSSNAFNIRIYFKPNSVYNTYQFESEDYMKSFISYMKEHIQLAKYDQKCIIALEDKVKILAEMVDELRTQIK